MSIKPAAAQDSLIGKTVATPSAGPLAGHISSNTPEIRLVTTADYDETLRLLLDGNVDAAALNLQVGSGLVNGKYPNKVTLPSHPFFELPLAVVTLKGKFRD
ncbi:transporter substrate-binding domain-containing protein, partial [Jatrophihabitans sp.]|uniref:transporter substrate-binding domain-containing protein n=1 Tax=Jatrophihabitans sp. TaxID=1932789 RepID=UPI0030C6BDAB